MEEALFDRCANGRCAEHFDYRKGRLFRFSYRLNNVASGASHAVVHFWLCANCAKVYTLEYREKSGAAVLRLKNSSTKAAKPGADGEFGYAAAAAKN